MGATSAKATAATGVPMPSAPPASNTLMGIFGGGKRKMTADEKYKEVRHGCDKSAYDDCPYVNDLVKQLNGSRYWTGICCVDLWFFICNGHPFLGMFWSHPMHPWGKRERVFSFATSTAFTLLLTAFYIKGLDALWLDGQVRAGVLFCFVTVPVIIFETVWYWLSVGDVFCQHGFLRPCHHAIHQAQYACGVCGAALALMMLILSYALLKESDVMSVAQPLLTSRIQGYVLWLPVFILMPCTGFLSCWCSERKAGGIYGQSSSSSDGSSSDGSSSAVSSWWPSR